MSLTKRIKGDYTIETVVYGDSIILAPAELDPDNPGEVLVAGDLRVQGKTTTIEASDLVIVDNTIVLNSGEDGPGITHIDGTAGIIIDRGPATTNAEIRYNESVNLWQVHDGTTWESIVTGTGGLAAVVNDLDPHLGGDLIVAGYAITSEPASNLDVVLDADGTGLVKVNHKLSLEHESTPAQYNEIYADAVGSGGTGLYTGVDEELVSKAKAIAFSLIF